MPHLPRPPLHSTLQTSVSCTLSPQAPCWPMLFIEYIFYSATFFHLSWQLQLLWGLVQRGTGPKVFFWASIMLQRTMAISNSNGRRLTYLGLLMVSCLYYWRRSDRNYTTPHEKINPCKATGCVQPEHGQLERLSKQQTKKQYNLLLTPLPLVMINRTEGCNL